MGQERPPHTIPSNAALSGLLFQRRSNEQGRQARRERGGPGGGRCGSGSTTTTGRRINAADTDAAQASADTYQARDGAGR